MYEEFYRLTGKPFQLNPDPTFFFASRGHKRAMAYLQYGLYQGEGFIAIPREIGAGKTTMIRSLLEQLDPEKFVAAQLVSTQLDAEDTLRAVAMAFELQIAAADKARLLSDLEKFFISLKASNKRAVLIVDEAQNLTPRAIEELRMLSNFQVGETALLQSFLVGQPELRQMMRSSQMQQLRQRVIASYHLGPMDRQETEAYIKHRLKHVGWKSDPEFDVATFDAIYAFAHGIPRRINTLCNRLMLAGYLLEVHTLTGEHVASVVDEIKEEIGDDAGSEEQVTQPTNRASAPGNTGLGSPQSADHPEAVAQGSPRNIRAPSILEARVLRLEKTVATALDILHRILRVVPPPKHDIKSELK